MTKLLVFFFSFCSFLAVFAQKQAVLVKDEKPIFTITISTEPTESESKAAELLQSSIKKMAHCELQIVKTDKPNHLYYLRINKPEKRF